MAPLRRSAEVPEAKRGARKKGNLIFVFTTTDPLLLREVGAEHIRQKFSRVDCSTYVRSKLGARVNVITSAFPGKEVVADFFGRQHVSAE